MTQQGSYKSVSQHFYDYLLVKARMREKVQITFSDENNTENTILDIVFGMYLQKGIEYLSTQNGKIIRLDKLISVGEEQAFKKDASDNAVKLKFGNCGINPDDDPCGDAIEY